MPDLNSRVRVNEGILFQELEGEAVLLNVKTGVYFGLDAVGTHIWKLLSEQKSLLEIAGAIVREYDVDARQCEADVIDLVATLESQGLVTTSVT